MIKYMALAVTVVVSGGVAVPVAVPVAGLTKRCLNQKDILIKVWGYENLDGGQAVCAWRLLTGRVFVV